MLSIFDYIIIGAAALLSLLILVQTRGASLGAGFGSSAEINTVRRGAERNLHQITVLVVMVFAGAIVLSIIR